MNPQEIEAAVYSLNMEVAAAVGDGDELRQFSLKSGSDGYQQWIEFLGEPIWTSEDDPRKYDEAKDDYEPLEAFLLAQMVKTCELATKLGASLKKP